VAIQKRDPKTGAWSASYPDGSINPNARKTFDAAVNAGHDVRSLSLPGGLSAGEVAMLGPVGDPPAVANPDQLQPRRVGDKSGPLKDNDVGYLNGQVWSYPVPKKEEGGPVKILFSVVEGAERIYYVGGDRAKPKELARFSSAPYGDPALKATGKGLNRFYWTGRVQVVGDNGHIVDSRYNAPTAFPLFDNALLFASAFRGTGYEAISLNRADPNNVIARRVTYIDGVATEDSERIGIDTGPVTDFSYENNARVGGNLYKVPYTAYRYSSSGADDYIQQLNATTAVIWGEEVSLLIHSISNRTATINTSSEDFKAMFLAGNTVTLGETARSLLRGLQFALYLPNFLPIYRRSAFLCNWLPRVSPSEGVYESIAKFISFVATGGAAQLSAPFSVIDLETSAISEKTIKIYPLPSNPTIQIHSISYHP
jgi:hypothetical protein